MELEVALFSTVMYNSQCCGSGLFIPCPGFEFFHPGSRIKKSLKNLSIFNLKKCFLALEKIIWDVHPSRIRISFPSRIRIPDPGVKKAAEPGSVSATLIIVAISWRTLPLYLNKEQVSVIYSTFTIYPTYIVLSSCR
jgi:hypothetical protein